MINLSQFQELLGDQIFGGNADIAGMVIFLIVLTIIFVVLKRNIFASLVLAIPAAFVCSILGMINADLLMILIVVCIIGLVTVGKKSIGD